MENEQVIILKSINENIAKIVDILTKPQNKVEKILNIVAAIVTILGVFAIAEKVISFLK